jgi:hypothetical protein
VIVYLKKIRGENLMGIKKVLGKTSITLGVGLFIFSIISAWILTADFMKLGEDYWDTVGTSGKIFGYIWAFSFPLGSILFFLGVLALNNIENKRILIFLVSIISSLLSIINIEISRSSIFFGIGGILIEIFLIIILWCHGRKRMTLNDEEKKIEDLRIIGYLFLALASWFMCGLGTMVIFASKSATIDLYIDSTTTQTNMISIQYRIMICLIIGWFLISISHLKLQRLIKELKEPK